jgi:DNA-binding NarL/FixJ family response regulator
MRAPPPDLPSPGIHRCARRRQSPSWPFRSSPVEWRADGTSAIDLLRANGRRIDVILLDMTIPGASSREIVAEAANVRPDVKVILTSAYSQEMIAGAMSPPQIRSFIRKPFEFGDLLKTLRSSMSS